MLLRKFLSWKWWLPLLLGIAFWAVITRPLAGTFNKVIPFTNYQQESAVIQALTPGDHLQLLYHFWLGRDALSGHSPFFYNVYEFNMGNDADRFQPDLYYIPFSLIYAALSPTFGNAVGWNVAGLSSFLLGFIFTFLLAKRISGSAGTAVWITLIACSFPYRWITLFTGSPTGFAMAFVPMLAWGIDRIVRDGSIWGGVMAGLAVLFAYTTDLHVFYFSALAAPAFFLFSFLLLIANQEAIDFSFRSTVWKRKYWALLPCISLTVATLLIGILMSRHLADSVMSSGRTLQEVAMYSATPEGVFSTTPSGMNSHVYFGIPLLVLLAAALGFACWQSVAQRNKRVQYRLWLGGGMALAILIVIFLALGMNGPIEGIFFRACRKLIPKYTMIRQPVKIYCLIPTLLTCFFALTLPRFSTFWAWKQRPFRMAGTWVLMGLSIWAILSNDARTRPGFCHLPRHNAAYQAVSNDQPANQDDPARALALPLWPGDSHWTSLAEYAITLSRVRLLNGYAPAVPAAYFEMVFQQYESLNQGVTSDAQLDSLLQMGVRHILFHANAFPEKVSPFPAAITLYRLMEHPRLALLKDDGLTFAFRILPKLTIEHRPMMNWENPFYAAARSWSFSPPLELQIGEEYPLTFRAPTLLRDNTRYLLRLDTDSSTPIFQPVTETGISTLTQPEPAYPHWQAAQCPSPMGGVITAMTGPVVLQYALLTAGNLPETDENGTITLLPALFFHAGHMSPGQPSVTFTPQTVSPGLVWYGPHLPIPPGVYDLVLTYTTDAEPGVTIGELAIYTLPDMECWNKQVVMSDSSTAVMHSLSWGAVPFRVEFSYAANATVTLQSVRLVPTRIFLVSQ